MSRKTLSSFDLFRLVGELSFLDNGIIRDVRSRKNELYLLIFKGEEQWLRIIPGKYIAISRNKPEETAEYPFTLRVKNALSGKRVHISMHGSDRIIEISSDNVKIIAELFSNGNISLVSDGVIEMSMFIRRYVTRTVSSGEKYAYPSEKIDVFSADYNNFSGALSSSKTESVVKAIAVELSLGGLYAEELCYRSGIKKDKKPSELDESDTRNLFDCFMSMLSEPEKPSIIAKQSLAVIEIKHTTADRDYFTSINEAVTEFFRESINTAEKQTKKEKINEAISEYEKALDYMNSNYIDIEDAITTASDSKTPIEGRRSMLSENGWNLDGKFIVRNDDKNVKIDVTVPVRKTISDYYDKLKKLKSTMQKKDQPHPAFRKIPLIKEESWYSKFRWAITSNGCLVIVGKDSNQNMSLLEKHTDKEDLVLHADIFGSPFGVIKPGKAGIKKEDIEEASSIVAAYSSAWKAGAGNIDVYYVKPSQVKKGAPSGEYLKKGAAYIEGKREYIKDSQLGLFISIYVSDKGYSLVVTAHRPDSAHVLIRPGNKKREDIINKIIKIFAENTGVLVSKDAVDKLLPPGKASLSK
ncbi:MAG: NFACT family protein [Candidatus Parvarchaeota archaeon]|nr:NFACT family protein [Candidatus Parvarchaeota archaeon]